MRRTRAVLVKNDAFLVDRWSIKDANFDRKQRMGHVRYAKVGEIFSAKVSGLDWEGNYHLFAVIMFANMTAFLQDFIKYHNTKQNQVMGSAGCR